MSTPLRRFRSFVSVTVLLLLWGASVPGQSLTFAQSTVCDGQTGGALLTCVQSTYALSNPLGYDPARDVLYSQVESDASNQLEGIYSGFTITLDPNADPSSDAFQKGINAEHVFPQSRGAGNEPERGDMHNLYPCRSSVNSSRGNLPFGESPDAETDTWFYLTTATSTIPPLSERDNYSERGFTWEPREAKKGDIARAVFYFYTIHRAEADTRFFENMQEVLLTWHQTDPVTQAERDRSALIASAQGNQNPFVVDETLAERLYGEGAGGGDLITIIDEDFEGGSIPATWTTFDASGSNDWIVDDFSGNRYAKMTEFRGSGIHNDWLITPEVDFDAYDDETLTFFTKTGFRDGDALSVLISSDYSGTGDPSGATWTELSVTLSDHVGDGYANGFTGSGLVDLSARTGTGHIAYHYVQSATPLVEGEWQVDDVLLQASGTVVPVELASFTVGANGAGGAILEWATASETNNAGFDILHQAPETSRFVSAGFVEGAGTTSATQRYRFPMSNLTDGTHRFRLRQVDVDGTETLSDPRMLTISAPGTVTLSGPNPIRAGQRATVTVTPAVRGDVAVHLFDMLGRRVKVLHDGAVAARQPLTVSVDGAGLASGMYLLRVTGPSQSETRRVSIIQ